METILFYQMNSEYLPVVKWTDKVSVEPPHVHIRRKAEEFILYYVLYGEMHINEGGRHFVLKPDDMLILDPHREHYGTKATACTYFYIHFYHKNMEECCSNKEHLKDDMIDGRLNSLKTNERDIMEAGFSDIILPKFLHISQTGTAATLVDDLYKLRESHHNHTEHYQLKTSSIFLEFLVSLSREMTSGFLSCDSTTPTTRSTRMIHDLLSFFQDNYASEITGEGIEEKYKCNYDYLNRMFKKATGNTIFAYLNDLRIFKARQLLSDGTGKMIEVAEKCGFKDIYYFSKVFKKYTGFSPGTYSR